MTLWRDNSIARGSGQRTTPCDTVGPEAVASEKFGITPFFRVWAEDLSDASSARFERRPSDYLMRTQRRDAREAGANDGRSSVGTSFHQRVSLSSGEGEEGGRGGASMGHRVRAQQGRRRQAEMGMCAENLEQGGGGVKPQRGPVACEDY